MVPACTMDAGEIWDYISDAFQSNPEYFGYAALGILAWEILLFSTLGLYIFIRRRRKINEMRDFERNYELMASRVIKGEP